MKTQLAGIALIAATVAAVAFYPAAKLKAGTHTTVSTVATDPAPVHGHGGQQRPRIELVFVLDTTSSMSGFIQAAKEKIWSIATTMASAQPAPEIKIGLVAFRDRGDAYITQVTDLSSDLDSVYVRLMDFKAVGGGDGPESVNQALFDAVHKISWSNNDEAYKVVFLVGDAVPHMDYADDVRYPLTLAAAQQKGIRVNAIQSGQDALTAQTWRHIANLSQGEFLNVTVDGDAVAVATPFDHDIAALSRELDDTRLYFGSAEEKASQKLKTDAATKVHEEASLATRARRAAFNLSAGGRENFLGRKELVDAVAAGDVSLNEIDVDELPSVLQTMAPEERELAVKKQAGKRDDLQRKIKDLARERDGYIAQEVAADGGAEESLDNKLYETIRRQAAEKGMVYEAAPKY